MTFRKFKITNFKKPIICGLHYILIGHSWWLVGPKSRVGLKWQLEGRWWWARVLCRIQSVQSSWGQKEHGMFKEMKKTKALLVTLRILSFVLRSTGSNLRVLNRVLSFQEVCSWCMRVRELWLNVARLSESKLPAPAQKMVGVEAFGQAVRRCHQAGGSRILTINCPHPRIWDTNTPAKGKSRHLGIVLCSVHFQLGQCWELEETFQKSPKLSRSLITELGLYKALAEVWWREGQGQGSPAYVGISGSVLWKSALGNHRERARVRAWRPGLWPAPGGGGVTWRSFPFKPQVLHWQTQATVRQVLLSSCFSKCILVSC